MNILSKTIVYTCLLLSLAIDSNTAEAALPIYLEVATEAGAPVTAQQEWVRLLGRMNLGQVRLRRARGGEQTKIESKKQGNSTRYQVFAIINRRNELILPQRKFRISDRGALQKYFDQLPVQAAYNAEERGRFGLTEKQFRLLYAEFSQPIGFSTVGKTSRAVIARIERTLDLPFAGLSSVPLNSKMQITAELKNLSTGTALAYVLRREGLAMRPEQLPGKSLRLNVVAYDSPQETWPVGWKPAVSSRQAAPQLYKLRSIEIDGFTLSQALTALQPALKIPVLMDDSILARQKIDPAKIQVSLPKKRTYLKSALGKLLSQARLAEEVRVDEQEQPFLWITRFGKHSPVATR